MECGTPSALSYESEADIINHIKNEEMSIGYTDNSLASLCKTYLDLNNKSYEYIFNTDTYTNNFATARHAFSGSCADDTNDAIGPITVGWRPDVPVNTNNRKWYTVYAGTPYDSHEATAKSAGDLA